MGRVSCTQQHPRRQHDVSDVKPSVQSMSKAAGKFTGCILELQALGRQLRCPLKTPSVKKQMLSNAPNAEVITIHM
jgi:hypothetical protein